MHPKDIKPTMEMPTRQQLDELESLMQRMLELPMHPTEIREPLPPLPEPPAPTFDPVQTMIVSPPAVTFSKMEAFPSRFKLVIKDPHPLVPEEVPVLEAPPTSLQPQYPPRVSVPIVLAPLVLLTAGFDAATGWIPGGKWLHRPAGKSLVGLCGLLMFGSALGWVVVEGMGWIW